MSNKSQGSGFVKDEREREFGTRSLEVAQERYIRESRNNRKEYRFRTRAENLM